MRTREHMGHVLEATGLYRLTGDTPVDWELSAYGAGFARLEERFQGILEDMFPQTAGREKLAQWETLFRPQPAEASLEECREMVLQRFSVGEEDFTPEDVQNLLVGAGVRGLLVEEKNSLQVILGKLLGVSEEEASREMDRLLPAHLPWSWDKSVTWVALDAYSKSFGAWSDLGWTWEQWDGVTREQLTSEEEI